jgi:CBS domain-containing protein
MDNTLSDFVKTDCDSVSAVSGHLFPGGTAMKIFEVMEKDVTSCSPDDTLDAIAMLMWQNDCGSVAVVDQAGTAVGIITDRDIAMSCALNHKSLWDLCARDVTNNRPLYTCKENDDVGVALGIMQAQKIRRLPIVSESGHLRGIISTDDIVARSDEKMPDLSFRDTMKTLKAVCIHH